MKLPHHLPVALLLIVTACRSGDDVKTDSEYEAEIVANMHALLLSQVKGLNQAAHDLQTAAPLPDGRGWDDSDAPAIAAMKTAWINARVAWEPAEGVLAPLFADLDQSLDSRYEDFLNKLGGDDNLFDGTGVTGMHAIERILYAHETPAAVQAKEQSFTGYVEAAWPATQLEASTFKTGLCDRLVSDSQRLIDAWEPRAIDLSEVFVGLTALMDEQQEKVKLAANQEEESRYSQRTLADLRDNLAGTRAVYGLFIPWLGIKPFGYSMNQDVQSAFDRLDQTYATVTGDAIPPPPATWNSDLPTPTDQQSPFGKLYVAVVQEVDASRAGSAVDSMNHVAMKLGLPEFAGD